MTFVTCFSKLVFKSTSGIVRSLFAHRPGGPVARQLLNYTMPRQQRLMYFNDARHFYLFV